MSPLRQDLLSIFTGKPDEHTPAFSGLISVTAPGLEQAGLRFHETHRDAQKMARAAISTHRACGLGSAVVPLDMCVEAEALGAWIDFREGERAEYPRVAGFLFDSVDRFTAGLAENAEKGFDRFAVRNMGRIPMVCEAFGILKEEPGEQVVIGGYLPGPFTLLSLLVETGALYTALRKPEGIHRALECLAHLLAEVGAAYRKAGADFLTIHEMGGSPGALGPKVFASVVLPHLQSLFASLPRPAVLSACGRTNGAMGLLAASGADALSVDQTNELAASRAELPEALLFGNLDPVGLLAQGTPTEIRAAAATARKAGVNAVWPGCDLFLQTPLENLRAVVEV